MFVLSHPIDRSVLGPRHRIAEAADMKSVLDQVSWEKLVILDNLETGDVRLLSTVLLSPYRLEEVDGEMFIVGFDRYWGVPTRGRIRAVSRDDQVVQLFEVMSTILGAWRSPFNDGEASLHFLN